MLEKLQYIDAQELLLYPIDRPRFLVEEIIPSGVHLLCGDEKTGKSWMMLDLCLCVAEGKEFLGFPTQQGEVVYFCLEDTFWRIQDRLFRVTDEVKGRLRLILQGKTIAEGLCDQIKKHLGDHPRTKLIVIDTFQMVRDPSKDCSYAGDYADVAAMKALSRDYAITIILVHHVRKQGDPRNIFNTASGTKGLIGAVDTTYILDKESPDSPQAQVFARGRDLIYTEMTLRFRDFHWELLERKTQKQLEREKIPQILFRLVDYLKKTGHWEGTATQMLQQLGETEIAPQIFSKYVNQHRLGLLLDEGIEYRYRKLRDRRLMEFSFCDDGDDGDGDIGSGE